MRRFFAPDKETAQRFQGAKNVPEKNRIKARSADCGFS
jgi:hypothetical protein